MPNVIVPAVLTHVTVACNAFIAASKLEPAAPIRLTTGSGGDTAPHPLVLSFGHAS